MSALKNNPDPARCPNCGERVSPQATACWLCGAQLDPRRWHRPRGLPQRARAYWRSLTSKQDAD
ncbi:MAG TPA: hypothetical protein VF257_17315 [Solirubrobacteraceae bacterium]